eukprot:TRINITY_DN1947_c1_g1_i1.p1 TRINITY_DN1947_c1_g1~~TRINITY_DN1947_c1_g1_i1.p1  ORF type:complete len:627 (+),score=164.25 TRINITY_DN1947_c1_g1_i1:50-1930(+)
MDLMWLFTVPVLKLAIKIALSFSSIFLVIQTIRWSFQAKPKNPFETDERKPRKKYEHDQKKRNAVIAQSFSKDKIPEKLDAIVIGSGIGGMATAAIMSKSGKRVLVLEQHDQAGGCCHTFIDKGYEFDVGIHYIGEMNTQSLNKTLSDQLTEGQLEWEPLDPDFDVISIGYGDDNRKYNVKTGFDKWANYLKERFDPSEHAAIDKYFELVGKCEKNSQLHGAMKLLPHWLVKLAIKLGATRFFNNYHEIYMERTMDVVNRLTKNPELRTIFTYCWGDYGTPPSRSNFHMQALLNRHFSSGGGAYPVGGASEIAYNIIPVIEAAGGKVLVRANVTGIIQKGHKVGGVRVVKGSETHDILAPMVISSAGVYNTFQTLLPKELSAKSYYTDIARTLKPGVASMNVFLGLDISNEELEVRKQNVWAFTTADSDKAAMDYFNLSAEGAMDAPVPLLFISFPSTKDPEWDNHPGRKGKSTAAIVTLANWDWFKAWKDKGVKKRGDEYDELKKSIGDQMIEQTCKLFPQIRDKIDYQEIGSPVTNNHYIAAPHGEIYGLDHSRERFDAEMVAKLRPETDIPGLYLTGQDILTCGFTGALFAGVLTAQACLGRNVMYDLISLHKKVLKQNKKLE